MKLVKRNSNTRKPTYVRLLVLFEILGPFELFGTLCAFVWLERDVDSDMRRHVVALSDFDCTARPPAF